MRWGRSFAGALVAGLALAAPATAHIDVLPTEVELEEPVELTVRVPNERDLPTTAVRVDFPDAVTVFSFKDPPAGWTLQPIRSEDGRIVGVEYTGGRIGVARFEDFMFLGTPFEVGQAVWPAEQTYADGQVKPWTGTPDADDTIETGPTDPGPAAAIEVLEPGEVVANSLAASSGDDGDESGAAIWLGVIAIGIAVLAALGVGLLWSSRPAKLPPDSE